MIRTLPASVPALSVRVLLGRRSAATRSARFTNSILINGEAEFTTPCDAIKATCEKFNRYDEFTYYCASRSLEFYHMNPNAWIIRGKSLERIIHDYLMRTGNVIDDYAAYLINLMDETKLSLDKTYMTEETEDIRERRKQQTIEAQEYIKEKTQSK